MFIFRGEGEGEGGISLRLHEYVERERRGEQRRKERHKMVTVNKPISKVPGMILILIAALRFLRCHVNPAPSLVIRRLTGFFF